MSIAVAVRRHLAGHMPSLPLQMSAAALAPPAAFATFDLDRAVIRVGEHVVYGVSLDSGRTYRGPAPLKAGP